MVSMKKSLITIFVVLSAIMGGSMTPAFSAQYMRDITVAADGSGDFTSLNEAMEAIRAFMDYKVTVKIKNGVYREKWVVPAWIENVEFIGENPDSTIITWNDHANINKMGTFRTYTLKVDGSDILFRNLTIENNAERLGQAVALHTQGDRLTFVNCRFLGNQDTIYTGGKRTRMLFDGCYIEGTTDFIFGPSTAYFKGCRIHSKADSYVTAASTPADVAVGYVFEDCELTADEGVTKVYLGRPWRPYAHTAFINCRMGRHIVPEGWHNWRDPANEKTARYCEYGSTGDGAAAGERVAWSRQLGAAEAKALCDTRFIFNQDYDWTPSK